MYAINIQLRQPTPAAPHGPWTPLRPLRFSYLSHAGEVSAPGPTPADLTDQLLEAAADLEDGLLQHVFHVYGYCAMLNCNIEWNDDGDLVFEFPVSSDAGDPDHLVSIHAPTMGCDSIDATGTLKFVNNKNGRFN